MAVLFADEKDIEFNAKNNLNTSRTSKMLYEFVQRIFENEPG
jgi:hypothetical protein